MNRAELEQLLTDAQSTMLTQMERQVGALERIAQGVEAFIEILREDRRKAAES